MEGFYPIYATAQRTFGVNWLLLASIHMQESAFSTAPGTYHGLNFAGCCGGPMQFNVTNGPVTTWELVSDSYIYGRAPARYDHMTAKHPSIYDDFDSIMAAAHLLSADGADYALDGAAWAAAYDYYGHDRDRRGVRRRGARARDRLVPARLLHQLRRARARSCRRCTPPTARRCWRRSKRKNARRRRRRSRRRGNARAPAARRRSTRGRGSGRAHGSPAGPRG